jgi:hypothetical protein
MMFCKPAEINIQISVGIRKVNGFPDRFAVPPVEAKSFI